MDKNMISIDDLVKQRLSGREEKERPGAWLYMKDLLDKEMPVAAASPIAGNIRRSLGYAAALLLLAGISFGGYEVSRQFRGGNTSLAATNENTANGSSMAAPSIVNQPVKGNKTVSNTTATQKTAANTINNKQAAEKKEVVSAANSIGNPNRRGNDHKVSKGLATGILSSSTGKLTTNNNISKHANSDISNNKDLNTNKKEHVIASGASGSNNKLNTTKNNNNEAKQPAPVPAPNSSLNNTAGNKLPAKGNDEPKKPNQPVGNVADNNSTSKAPEMGGGVKKQSLQMDSINKIETRQVYTGKGRFKTDTISKGKVALARYSVIEDINELMAVNKKQTADNLIVPAAAVPGASAEEHMVALADHKISSTKNTGTYPSRFEEMVKNAKMSMNGVSFYPGILAGVNCSAVNGKPAFGFQAGLTGLVKMSERWSILTELKYMNNITNRTTIDDGYNKDLTSQVDMGNNAIITYRWDSVAHNFGYSSLSSLHLPVALRFSAGRVNVFGGLNMAYNFGVNIYDGGATYHKSDTRPVDQGGFTWQSGTPKYDVANDFKAKFGLGYLMGASYQVSPAMQVDLRVATQSIWNNSKTAGSKDVFNHLYRNPSFQLNASYRLSNAKYRRKH